jgi:hypothetical protein
MASSASPPARPTSPISSTTPGSCLRCCSLNAVLPLTPPPLAKIAVASFVGTAIEYYDFFLYGVAAALTFTRLFFPSFDPLVGTLAAFATFAIGVRYGHVAGLSVVDGARRRIDAVHCHRVAGRLGRQRGARRSVHDRHWRGDRRLGLGGSRDAGRRYERGDPASVDSSD